MDRFILQRSTRPGWWVLTDTQNAVVVRFEQGRFNESQKITGLNDEPVSDYMAVARVMREIGEYMYENHKDLI
ncbi:hypothetical protein [Prevotella sp. KH2C16]|uniref:hypothetical protein n=1 Tax=Prevotella sp. KH2C16 TaxID=1855325 RepID=UPI0008DF8380|nr:hypothetical protein [Prevotella sp. KH2C16]SFG38260.1 hypothetical protein SAMN05216383_11213 [Prevotella sp. KH2C16]SFG75477.1 hypothetical protein SAMN05216383_1399 [Prevotella sp. KH2C16]